MPDSSVLTDICFALNNFFPPLNKKKDLSFIHRSTFSIYNGTVSGMDFIRDGQYFRIAGSVFNDGVYRNDAADLKRLRNEEFTGAVWEMAVPDDFLALCDDVQAYRVKLDELKVSDKGFASESFGGYSYSMGCSAPAYLQEWSKRISKAMNKYRRFSVL